jgi:hypothetical protein
MTHGIERMGLTFSQRIPESEGHVMGAEVSAHEVRNRPGAGQLPNAQFVLSKLRVCL